MVLSAATPVLAADDEIVVEAGLPVPVPLESVAERLQAELPEVSVRIAPAAEAGTARTVTLGLSEDGTLLVVYRDAAGRQTTRIVADTGDPQAVAAAVAMIVANLHHSQVDSVLATLRSPERAPPPPSVVAAAPRPRVRSVVQTSSDGWLALGVAPFVNLPIGPTAMLGLRLDADATIGSWRLEAALAHAPGVDVSDVEYEQTTGVVMARRVFGGRDVHFGVGAGLGFLISAYTSVGLTDPEIVAAGAHDGAAAYSSSYLDALFVTGGSLDVRLGWSELWWTSRAELSVTTDGGATEARPVAPGGWLQVSTGLRVSL